MEHASLFTREAGHSTTARPYFNVAGTVYLVFICAYSLLLAWGMVLLWIHRASTAIRIRGLPILAAAILAIHVYLAAVFVVYPLNGWYKCTTEFWYMSVVFPLGIAIFQISNIRLLAYAKKQRELAEGQCWGEKKQHFELRSKSGFLAWFKQADWVKKSYLFIALALFIQLTVSFALFYGSKRFNPNVGKFGTYVSASECRRGFEWIPSVIWQFVTTWLLGPWVLFKSRHIKDTHYWALQTRLCIIAGLPGTPLWLAFLYANGPRVRAVAEWWPPAMWFAPGLIMMQVTSIVIPLFDSLYKRLGERRASSASSTESEDTTASKVSTIRTLASIDARRSKELASSFEAFEFQIRHNIEPLFQFAAYQDFTAENIQFLREVRNFKRKWRRLTTRPHTDKLLISATDERIMYEDAARVYFELVCPETSKCSINVDSKTYYKLQAVFKGLHYDPPGIDVPLRTLSPSSCDGKHDGICDVDVVAPWTTPLFSKRSRSPVRQNSESTVVADFGYEIADDLSLIAPARSKQSGSKKTSITVEVSEACTDVPSSSKFSSSDSPYGISGVPYCFDITVFDSAESSVKYLVYTNTWKSFVAGADVEGLVSIHETSIGRTLVAHGISTKGMSEFQQEATEEGYHHGILDLEAGPVAYEQVNAKCAHCRRRDRQRAEMHQVAMGVVDGL